MKSLYNDRFATKAVDADILKKLDNSSTHQKTTMNMGFLTTLMVDMQDSFARGWDGPEDAEQILIN